MLLNQYLKPESALFGLDELKRTLHHEIEVTVRLINDCNE